MGIDVYVLDFLLERSVAKSRELGRTLTLGRQGFHVKGDSKAMAAAVLRQYYPQASYGEIDDGGQYADALFRFIGCQSVTSLDMFGHEGSAISHDLNVPISDDREQSFDFVFDGGTIEHVYNVPQAFLNVSRLLSIGGLFILVGGANNMLGHGMYQFSPELLWTTFCSGNGFVVERMTLVDTFGFPSPRDAESPAAAGRRLEIGRTANPTYIMMAARKTSDRPRLTGYQSDYAAQWAK